MKKLGVVVENLAFDQMNFGLLKSINELSGSGLVDCVIFHNSWAKPPIQPLCSMIQMCHMWDFYGTVICTNIHATRRLIRCPGPKRKFFYVMDLEWTKLAKIHTNQLLEIYNNDEIELIARSQSHADLLTKLFKPPTLIMDDWDLEVLKGKVY